MTDPNADLAALDAAFEADVAALRARARAAADAVAHKAMYLHDLATPVHAAPPAFQPEPEPQAESYDSFDLDAVDTAALTAEPEAPFLDGEANGRPQYDPPPFRANPSPDHPLLDVPLHEAVTSPPAEVVDTDDDGIPLWVDPS